MVWCVATFLKKYENKKIHIIQYSPYAAVSPDLIATNIQIFTLRPRTGCHSVLLTWGSQTLDTEHSLQFQDIVRPGHIKKRTEVSIITSWSSSSTAILGVNYQTLACFYPFCSLPKCTQMVLLLAQYRFCTLYAKGVRLTKTQFSFIVTFRGVTCTSPCHSVISQKVTDVQCLYKFLYFNILNFRGCFEMKEYQVLSPSIQLVVWSDWMEKGGTKKRLGCDIYQI